MKSQGVPSTVVKALTTGLVAAALLFAVPAKSHAQIAVGVQFGQPAYGYGYDDGRDAYRNHEHWEHEEHERAEAYARQQAWEQQQAWNRQQAWEQQQAWGRQQQYLRHEAWEHNDYRDRGYDHHDGDRGDGRDGNRWR